MSHVIKIGDYDWWGESYWTMELDLDCIVADSGVRRTVIHPDGTAEKCVALPIPQVKRMLKLIIEYGDDDDIETCDKLFQVNEKLLKAWINSKQKWIKR